MNILAIPNVETTYSAIDGVLIRANAALANSSTTARAFADFLSELDPLGADLKTVIHHFDGISTDPLSSRTAVSDARRALHDVRDEQERLDDMQQRLVAAREAAKEREDNAASQASYDAARAGRDALADRIRTEAPAYINGLHALAQDICASNAEIAAVNADLPAGADPLNMVEGEARNFADTDLKGQESRATVRITQAVLPDPNDRQNVLWPPLAPVEQERLKRQTLLPAEEIQRRWSKAR